MEKIELNWSVLAGLDEQTIQLIDDNLQGIYRLSYRHEDKNIYVFFVGKSTDIKKQLLIHISEKEENVCIKNFKILKTCYFKYAVIEEDNLRDLSYKQICKFYQPSCNTDKIPTGEDIISLNVN